MANKKWKEAMSAAIFTERVSYSLNLQFQRTKPRFNKDIPNKIKLSTTLAVIGLSSRNLFDYKNPPSLIGKC